MTDSVEDISIDSVGEPTLKMSNTNMIYQHTYYGRNGNMSTLSSTDMDNSITPENSYRTNKVLSSDLPRLTAKQYASRRVVLSSVVVTWSPMLSSSEICCAILAIGAKSGAISLWRIYESACYTIEHGNASVKAEILGLIPAHNSWITAICFSISSASSSDPQLVMATGSYDGSVKIWFGNVKRLLLQAEVDNDCFSLMAKVTTDSTSPVSTIALVVQEKAPENVVLAVGRGAGSLEIWVYVATCKKLECAGDYNAHEQVVTGLTWTFDGYFLYSCGQDNSIHGWIFHGNTLHEAPLPSKFPTSDECNNLSKVSDLCFGLAISPGGLMLAVVRSLDGDLQHQMYEKRSQRAIVEFFWTAGQSLEIPVPSRKNVDHRQSESLIEAELTCWENNILWSLKCFENVRKPVVVWDLTTLLAALRKALPDFVDSILTKWISTWSARPWNGSIEEMIFDGDPEMLTTISSRKIGLLSIICRRVVLGDAELGKDEQCWWNKLLARCERELRARLLAFAFRAVANRAAEGGASWSPPGAAQMEQWASVDPDAALDLHRIRGVEIACLGSRSGGTCEHAGEERCGFCSARVPFESPETAWCEGVGGEGRVRDRHRLVRCAASMRVCSVEEPQWLCVCCRRWVADLLPGSFFVMMDSPAKDGNGNKGSPAGRPRPLCPFCGILLQRSLPDFLLAASPV